MRQQVRKVVARKAMENEAGGQKAHETVPDDE